EPLIGCRFINEPASVPIDGDDPGLCPVEKEMREDGGAAILARSHGGRCPESGIGMALGKRTARSERKIDAAAAIVGGRRRILGSRLGIKRFAQALVMGKSAGGDHDSLARRNCLAAKHDP